MSWQLESAPNAHSSGTPGLTQAVNVRAQPDSSYCRSPPASARTRLVTFPRMCGQVHSKKLVCGSERFAPSAPGASARPRSAKRGPSLGHWANAKIVPWITSDLPNDG